jgi:hypothetical protein
LAVQKLQNLRRREPAIQPHPEDNSGKSNIQAPKQPAQNTNRTAGAGNKQVYCQRGDLENRIKELHYGMEIGRTSCTSFWANQFRVLMTAAAYVLMQELRLRLARTDCARAQVSTLRQRFLKLGVQVIATVRRVVLHLPQTFPYRDSFHRLALSLGAQTG